MDERVKQPPLPVREKNGREDGEETKRESYKKGVPITLPAQAILRPLQIIITRNRYISLQSKKEKA